jgi:hypothetical protein
MSLSTSMSLATSSAVPAGRRSFSRRDPHVGRRSLPSRLPVPHETIEIHAPLGRYRDRQGRARELLALPGRGGSVLVLDRDALTLRDRRLVAHLAADEPLENAELVCNHYLRDTKGRWCRRMRAEDLRIPPLACEVDRGRDDLNCQDGLVAGRDGNFYRLSLVRGERCVPQMRWCRAALRSDDPCREQTSLREVVGVVEDYEPMRTLTEQAIALHDKDHDVSVTRLRSELERLQGSPVVLNRRLRETVLDTVDREGTSMSEIALRCGVVKRDRRGNLSGETSWLARRIGVMPEGGEKAITPWIHSEVLGTIARKGLRISPREVELQ